MGWTASSPSSRVTGEAASVSKRVSSPDSRRSSSWSMAFSERRTVVPVPVLPATRAREETASTRRPWSEPVKASWARCWEDPVTMAIDAGARRHSGPTSSLNAAKTSGSESATSSASPASPRTPRVVVPVCSMHTAPAWVRTADTSCRALNVNAAP